MKKVTTILTVLTVLVMCSCGKNQEYESLSADMATATEMAVEETSLQMTEPQTDKTKTIERKVVKEGDISFKTADVNKTKSLIVKTVQGLNGYIAKDNAYDYSDRLEHYLIIRVPADKFDLLLANISENVEKFDSKNIDVVDVTEEYIDMQARIKTKKELQNRYVELLKRAATIDEILRIEREIGNLQTEIESIEGRMNYLKDKIAFSTLTVTYYQKETSSFGFFSKVAEALESGWSGFLWFIIGLSYMWVFIVIAVGTIYLIVRRKRKRKKTLIPIVITFSLLLGTVTAQDNMPSREQRIYDLSLIWQEMKYNFVYAERFQQVNIDTLYLAYLPKVEQVTNEYEYFRVLNAFMAHFNEGHTRIYATERPDTPPPIEVINFDEKIIVSNIAKGMADKVPIGSEIIKVNHIPVLDFLKDSIFPYIAASNSHWKFDKSVSEMLYGLPQSTVKITVKTPEGKENEVEMTRGTKEEMVHTTTFSPINIKIINEGIGYIHLASCLLQYVDEIDSVFLSWAPQLRDCKGLIVDIRGNRGGGSRAWMMVAALLTESINKMGENYSKKHVPAYKKWGKNNPPYKDYYLGTALEEITFPPIETNIPDSLQLHQPLIVISGPCVASASESFLALMKETGRATVIGEPSVGVLTEPITVPLSGGNLNALIAIIKYINPEGTDSNLTGIVPDIEVKRDYAAYLKGKDNVLERAIEELQ